MNEAKKITVCWKAKPSRYSKEHIAAAIARAKEKNQVVRATKAVVRELIHDPQLFDVAVDVLPAEVIPKVQVVAQAVPEGTRTADIQTLLGGLLLSGAMLKQYRMVPSLPDKIKRVSIVPTEPREELHYSIGSFPELKEKDDFSASAELFNYSCNERITEYIAYMRVMSSILHKPMLALTKEDVKTPFSEDLFRTFPDQFVGVTPQSVIKNELSKYIMSIQDGECAILWGDAGRALVQLSYYLPDDINVKFIGSRDYPLSEYDKYERFVRSGFDLKRISKIEYDIPMSEVFSHYDFSRSHVIANYVPVPPLQCRSMFAVCVSAKYAFKNRKVVVLPPGMSRVQMSAYIEATMMTKGKAMKKLLFLDPVTAVYYRYHHHNVWPDHVMRAPGIPVFSIIQASRDSFSYEGALLLRYDRNGIIATGRGDPFNPLRVARESVNLERCAVFSADNFEVRSYKGPLQDTTLFVNSTIIYAVKDGVRYVCDADIGGHTYVERRLRLLHAGFTVPPIDPGGNSAIPYEAKELYALVILTDVDDFQDDPELLISHVTFYGLAIVGGSLVYDGFSPFVPFDVRLSNDKMSKQGTSWRSRFVRKGHYGVGKFLFKEIADEWLGYEEFSLKHLDMLDIPAHFKDELKLMVVDSDLL